MKFIAALLLLLAAPLAFADCPFNQPVVDLQPQQIAGYSWGKPIRPLGDPCISRIGVEQLNDSAWYAGGWNGVYVTHDGGHTWTHPLAGRVGALLVAHISPNHDGVWAGIGNKLYGSADHGKTWKLLRTFGVATVSALLVNGNGLMVGLSFSDDKTPCGVWIGSFDGSAGQFRSFGSKQTCLITHTLARDPKSGALYAGTEICVHKQPYLPPFFRSDDGGVTWVDVGAPLKFHAVAAAVRPNGTLYAQLEGGALFASTNKGATWKMLAPLLSAPGLSLLLDPKRIYGGRANFQVYHGGIFVSNDGGLNFAEVGLHNASVNDVVMNAAGTRIFVASYSSGIYVSPVP